MVLPILERIRNEERTLSIFGELPAPTEAKSVQIDIGLLFEGGAAGQTVFTLREPSLPELYEAIERVQTLRADFPDVPASLGQQIAVVAAYHVEPMPKKGEEPRTVQYMQFALKYPVQWIRLVNQFGESFPNALGGQVEEKKPTSDTTL